GLAVDVAGLHRQQRADAVRRAAGDEHGAARRLHLAGERAGVLDGDAGGTVDRDAHEVDADAAGGLLLPASALLGRHAKTDELVDAGVGELRELLLGRLAGAVDVVHRCGGTADAEREEGIAVGRLAARLDRAGRERQEQERERGESAHHVDLSAGTARLPAARYARRPMRLWSLHPKYLDARGLVALWREGLLAQAVVPERVRGYPNHPQLHRFTHHPLPIDAISRYLVVIYQEAISRGYRFDPSKLAPVRTAVRLTVTESQLAHEWLHLLGKLAARDPRLYRRWRKVRFPEAHPIFVVDRKSVV